MLDLRPGDVHLWQAFPGADPHPARTDAYAALLSAPEREREARIRSAPDRHRFRVTRAMVRQVLAGHLGLDPAACEFDVNEHGRPSLAAHLAGSGSLRFNVSHTHDLVVLAVTRDCEIGVDVERLKATRRTVELARRFFAGFESERVAQAPEAERDAVFHRLWTLKESYIKARGLGLALPLDQFGFHLTESGPALWTHPELADPASRWMFFERQPTPEHRLAICVERLASPPRLAQHDFADFRMAA